MKNAHLVVMRNAAQRTSKSPSSSTAISVSSFFDSIGFRIAALVFRRARPKIVLPSCWSLRLEGEPPEMTSATDEVAKDRGDSEVVFAYNGSKCSRCP